MERRRFLEPQESKTPEPIDIKLDMGDYVGNLFSCTPIDPFWWFMAQKICFRVALKMCFRVVYVIFGEQATC